MRSSSSSSSTRCGPSTSFLVLLAVNAVLLLASATAQARRHGSPLVDVSGSSSSKRSFGLGTDSALLHTHRRRRHDRRRVDRLHPIAAKDAQRLQQEVLGTTPAGFSFATEDVTWSTYPFNPTGIPLAVRSPYVSTWLWGGTHDRQGDLATQFASFWNGNPLPWCGTAIIDGAAYTWMGTATACAPASIVATQQSLNFTATKSIFVMRAGPIDITATFLSPVLPSDLVRQSLPYSYLNVSVSANDNKSHTVQIYTDITGEWASNDWTRNITWTRQTMNNSLIVHEVELLDPIPFGEAADSTLYGQVVYATDSSYNTTYQSGPSSIIRQTFITGHALSNSADTNYRAISDDQPGFGLAKDFGSVPSTGSASALFSVGHYRDPAFSYTATNVTYSNRSLYFMTAYPSLQSSLSFFHNDFSTALSLSEAFDAQVQADATAYVSAEYAALCAIVARQVWSGTEITVGRNRNGQGLNASDVMIFMKEIATSNYVNTVDVLNPAWPFFAYTNPDMLEWMLLPVIEYSEQVFPHNWAPHDIGRAYPNATGAFQIDAPYYIEESSNMLFMSLAYTKFTGKTDLIQSHYAIHKQWAEFLVNSTLYPVLQASTDDFAGELANMTSLAVKGVVGIGCMGELASLAGNSGDATHYQTLAKQYASAVVSSAMASTGDHLKLTYQSDDSTWSSLYNLLPDQVFQLGIFDDSFYQMQAAWYAGQALPYGIPLDSRSQRTKTDFALWMAGVYDSNSTLRDAFINGVVDFLAYGETGQAVPDLYDAQNATAYAFVNRPVVGGIYANLALGKMRGALISSSSKNSNSSNNTNTTRIVSSAKTANARKAFKLW